MGLKSTPRNLRLDVGDMTLFVVGVPLSPFHESFEVKRLSDHKHDLVDETECSLWVLKGVVLLFWVPLNSESRYSLELTTLCESEITDTVENVNTHTPSYLPLFLRNSLTQITTFFRKITTLPTKVLSFLIDSGNF